MAGYRNNKLLTALEIVKHVKNWWTGWDLRMRHHSRPALLQFRNGLRLVCRGGTRDWDIVQEILFVGAYDFAMDFLRKQPGEPVVLDLGANIGLFSLLAASKHPNSRIFAYEPGPPNFHQFEINRLLNPQFSDRISLTREAAGGQSREAQWVFNSTNPGGSSLFASSGERYPVKIRAFDEILTAFPKEIALVKIDIEGSEYELMEATPTDHWQRVQSVVIELHDDPNGRSNPNEILKMFSRFGFTAFRENAGCYFLQKANSSA